MHNTNNIDLLIQRINNILADDSDWLRIIKKSSDLIFSKGLNFNDPDISTNDQEIADKYDILAIDNNLKRASDYLKLRETLEHRKVLSPEYAMYLEYSARHELMLVRDKAVKLLASSEEEDKAFWHDLLSLPIDDLCTEISSSSHQSFPLIQKKGRRLILCTDLFRDMDDCLSFVQWLISDNQYESIDMITSNEINGGCAKLLSEYAAVFTDFSKTIHKNDDFKIRVVRGLQAYDFAMLRTDNPIYQQLGITGIHYPPKTYHAGMRAAKIADIDSTYPFEAQRIYTMQEYFNELCSEQENGCFEKHSKADDSEEEGVDLVSIGKFSDAANIYGMLKALNIPVSTAITLGAKPESDGTNTHCGGLHHFKCLNDYPWIMLDSRYARSYKIQRKVEYENPGSDNPGHVYFYNTMIPQLMKLGTKSGKLCAELLLEHVRRLHYKVGNFYDLTSNIAKKYIHEQHSTKIYFYTDPKNGKIVCTQIEEKANKNNQYVGPFSVYYPNESAINENILSDLKADATRFYSIHSFLPNPQTKVIINAIFEKYPDVADRINLFGSFDDSIDDRECNTLNHADEYRMVIRALLILERLEHIAQYDHSTVDFNNTLTEVAKLFINGLNDRYYGFAELNKANESLVIENIAFVVNQIREVSQNASSFPELMWAYAMKNIAKSKRFLKEKLDPEDHREFEAQAWQSYTDEYFIKNPTEKALFERWKNVVDILLIFVRSPETWESPTNRLEDIINGRKILSKYYEKRITRKRKFGEEDRDDGREVFYQFLKSHGKMLNEKIRMIDLDYLLDFTDHKSCIEMPDPLKNTIAFIMLCGCLRFSQKKIEDRTQSVQNLWNSWVLPDNKEIVNQFTELLMHNIELTPSACQLFDMPALCVESSKSRKGFLINEKMGGMGGEIGEFIPVALKFILNRVENDKSKGKLTRNHHQIFQLIEFTVDHLKQMMDPPSEDLVMTYVNLGTPNAFLDLKACLQEYRRKQNIQSALAASTNPLTLFSSSNSSSLPANERENSVQAGPSPLNT